MVLAVENDEWAAKSFKANFGAYVQDIDVDDLDVVPRVELVVGGPPCQGFSPLGKTGDPQARHHLNRLWLDYLRIVKEVRPLMFLVENVPQFLKSDQFPKFKRYCSRYLKDYQIEYRVLNAADYGVPQIRRRGFILGSRVGLPGWPSPSHGPHSLSRRRYRTVRDAIADLPADPDESDLHWARNPRPSSLQRYAVIPEGGNRFDLQARRPDLLPDCWRNKPQGTTDVFGRLWWDKPSPTIRTEFFKPEKGRYLHPAADRPITHREAARLQSFPDGFAFEGSRTAVARQIGNAVPPRLASALGRQIVGYLRRL